MNSIAIGSSESRMIAMITSEKFSATDRQVAEQVAAEQEDRDPDERAGHVEHGEAACSDIRPTAGDEGREGADDGDEAGEEDRLAAVLLVEVLRLEQVIAVEEPGVGRWRTPWARGDSRSRS